MIRDIPSNERPREKVLNKGVSTLSDSELLALILKNGTKGVGVSELTYQLLNKYGDLFDLSKVSISELVNNRGIGVVKAIELVACFELGRRSIRKKSLVIKSANDVYDLFFDKIAFKPQEELHAIYLNNRKEIINTQMIFKGTINSSLIYPRDILREAIKENALYIILVHNHPSGVVEPSLADKEVTVSMRSLAHSLGLEVIDHIIIGYTTYYSFYDNGW